MRRHRARLQAFGAAALMLAAACQAPLVPLATGGTTAVTTPRPAPVPAAGRPAVTVPRVISQDPPEPAREFRGVWVATVENIDWPSSRALSSSAQQKELLAILDRAAALRLNAVIFQVRPSADALYASKLEPWSEYLTGTQGNAPDPFWDPLEFAVREAHARGLELHAWFNPFRARQSGARSPIAKSHIARSKPDLVRKYGDMLWMDPGEPAVRERTLKVVLDVVKRYDVDGIHLDDYFYPYPEAKNGKEVPFPDDASWRRYQRSGGTLDRADWRRQNVDQVIKALHDGVHDVKPWVKFGVSPFGIWRPGYPEQVRGFDAYEKLYADSRKWLREGWVDYFTPQLYWPTTKQEQAYPVLLQWWATENTLGRHMWPGNFTSRAGGTATGDFPVSELVEQIRVTRMQPGSTGNVHFSMRSFFTNRASLNDSLQAGPYAAPALVPATPWLRAPAPTTPQLALRRGRAPALQMTASRRTVPWQWLVQFRTDTGWTQTVLPGTTSEVPLPSGVVTTRVAVRALNRVGMESAPVLLDLPPVRAGDVDVRDAATGASRGH